MGVGTLVSRLRDGSWLSALIVAVLATGGLYLAYGGTPESSLAECLRSAPSGEADAPDPDADGDCAIAGPETFLDLSTAAHSLGLRVGADTPGDYAKSPKIRARAARSGGVPGTHGRWKPVGKGPLIANDPTYPGTYGEGFADLAGPRLRLLLRRPAQAPLRRGRQRRRLGFQERRRQLALDRRPAAHADGRLGRLLARPPRNRDRRHRRQRLRRQHLRRPRRLPHHQQRPDLEAVLEACRPVRSGFKAAVDPQHPR